VQKDGIHESIKHERWGKHKARMEYMKKDSKKIAIIG